MLPLNFALHAVFFSGFTGCLPWEWLIFSGLLTLLFHNPLLSSNVSFRDTNPVAAADSTGSAVKTPPGSFSWAWLQIPRRSLYPGFSFIGGVLLKPGKRRIALY